MLELKKSLNILLYTLEENLQHFEVLAQNFQSLPNLNKSLSDVHCIKETMKFVGLKKLSVV